MSSEYSSANPENRRAFREGIRAGAPIGAGYFAVSFALGVAARNAGLDAAQGGLASALCLASAGEYAGFTSIGANAAFWALILATIIANARYLLMSCALSQRAHEKLSFFHRAMIAYGLSDEIFGVTIARPGFVNPRFVYGVYVTALPPWILGTSLGVIAGNALPIRWGSAFSVTLFAMFIAIVIPPARSNRVLRVVVPASMLAGFAAEYIPGLNALDAGTRVVALTVLIATIAAIARPVPDEDGEDLQKKEEGAS